MGRSGRSAGGGGGTSWSRGSSFGPLEVTNAITVRDGMTISFVGIAGANAKPPNGARVGNNPILYFRTTGITNSGAHPWRLLVLGVLDEKGRTVGRGPSSAVLIPRMQLGVNYSADALRATFVFALHQPTNVVFNARARQGAP